MSLLSFPESFHCLQGYIQNLFFSPHSAAFLDPMVCPAFRVTLSTRTGLSLHWIIAVSVATTLHWITFLPSEAASQLAALPGCWMVGQCKQGAEGQGAGMRRMQTSGRARFHRSTAAAPPFQSRHSTGALESQTRSYWSLFACSFQKQRNTFFSTALLLRELDWFWRDNSFRHNKPAWGRHQHGKFLQEQLKL